MIQNLKAGSLDVIVALTEGIVADIARGASDLRILATYGRVTAGSLFIYIWGLLVNVQVSVVLRFF